MSKDVIGDFLTVIRNAIGVSKRFVVTPHSKMREEIARILKEEGFVKDFARVVAEEGKDKLRVDFKYVDGESVIHEMKRISRPGRRTYSGFSSLEPVIGGLGIAIVSTSSGLMTDRKARKLSVGGEVICSVW